jgi:hypothetical protein
MKKHAQHRQGPDKESLRTAHHQQIARLLTRNSEQLDENILSALRKSREIALQKQLIHEPVFSLSAIGQRAHNLMPHSPHQWVATFILLAAVIVSAIGYWQSAQVPLDIEILTDDLPIEVFVDQHE